MSKQKNRKSWKGRYNQAIYKDNLRRRGAFMDFEFVSIRDMSYDIPPRSVKLQRSTNEIIRKVKKKYDIFNGKVLWAIISDESLRYAIKKFVVSDLVLRKYLGVSGCFNVNEPLTRKHFSLVRFCQSFEVSLSSLDRFFSSNRYPTAEHPILFTNERSANKKMAELIKEQGDLSKYFERLMQKRGN